jgi:hypothetical protein
MQGIGNWHHLLKTSCRSSEDYHADCIFFVRGGPGRCGGCQCGVLGAPGRGQHDQPCCGGCKGDVGETTERWFQLEEYLQLLVEYLQLLELLEEQLQLLEEQLQLLELLLPAVLLQQLLLPVLLPHVLPACPLLPAGRDLLPAGCGDHVRRAAGSGSPGLHVPDLQSVLLLDLQLRQLLQQPPVRIAV